MGETGFGCRHPGCRDVETIKGWCRRHYMQRYSLFYWRANKADIVAFRRLYGRSKQMR
jgi:hypothetical protein